MDQNNSQELQKSSITIDDDNSNEFIMRINKYHHHHHLIQRSSLQLILSVFVLMSSLILCYSLGFSLWPHYFNLIGSRKCMFLVCNGILAFLARSSVPSRGSSTVSPSSSSSACDIVDSEFPSESDELSSEAKVSLDDENEVPESENTKSPEYNKVAVMEAEEDMQKKEEAKGDTLCGEEEEVRESKEDLTEKDEEAEEEMGEAEEEEEAAAAGGAAGNNEDIQTDELNRKIEEFIRKMKEEIRIEAQQQLIAV